MTPVAELVIESLLDGDEDRALANDVLDGFTKPFRELPPKHFYDGHGSELFEQICLQPEYYPTRCEWEILEDRAGEIAHLADASELLELGSGSAEKARVLLDGGAYERYLPVDVSEDALRSAATALAADFPHLRVHGIVADLERHLDQLPTPAGRRLVAFLGGTLGNFPPGSRRRLLRELAALAGGGGVLVGTDLVKDPGVLEAAYNDAAGVTAEFNRNVLRVINTHLDADFVPEAFAHVAFYDRRHEWIEMRLRAERACVARIDALDLVVPFAAGEEIRTEISAKFTRERLAADLAAAGLVAARTWTDSAGLFALTLAVPR